MVWSWALEKLARDASSSFADITTVQLLQKLAKQKKNTQPATLTGVTACRRLTAHAWHTHYASPTEVSAPVLLTRFNPLNPIKCIQMLWYSQNTVGHYIPLVIPCCPLYFSLEILQVMPHAKVFQSPPKLLVQHVPLLAVCLVWTIHMPFKKSGRIAMTQGEQRQ